MLRRSLTALAAVGLPVCVADKGTSPDFTEFLEALSGFEVTIPEASSLVGQVQSSLRAARRTERSFIFYAESDKEEFFRDGLRPFLTVAPDTDDVGVVLAARSASSFATFPAFQRFTERTINDTWFELTGQRGDYSYGPLMLNRALVPHLNDLGPEVGWGWRHVAVGVARRLGYRVVLIEGEYPCPSDQRQENDVDKHHRLRQLHQNILGVLRSLAPQDG